MPLGLANVLRLPVMILSAEHDVPFIDICLRHVMPDAVPVFLARYNTGAAHYSALIPDHKNHEDTSPSTNTSMTITSDKLQKKKIMAQNPQRNTGKRKRHELQELSRSNVNNFLSAKKKMMNKKVLLINLAEHFLLRAVVNNLLLSKGLDLISHVGYDYNCAVQVIRSDKVLSKIPVSS